MANQGKRLIPEDDLDYLQELKEAHADPSAEWGGETFTAGEGITIESETISVNYGSGLTVDNETLIIDTSTVALKTDIPSFTAGTGITINASNAISVDSTVALVSDLSVYQLNSNLVTTMDSSSTDAQYPSAKCVYDIIGDVESLLSSI